MRFSFESLEPRRLCAAGDQDLSYGESGFVRLKFADAAYQFLPGSDPLASATVLAMSVDGASFSVRRFNAGVPDASAGPNGTISTVPLPFDVPDERRAAPWRIWNLSGGRTLVEFVVSSRASAADAYFVRLNPDKSLDTAYGTGGVVAWEGGFFFDVVQQGDKLVAIRKTNISKPTVERYTDELQLDPTFGTDGVSRPPGRPFEIALQPDGKLVVATLYSEEITVRLTPDGQLDPTFGGDGIAVGGYIEAVRGVAVEDAGHIVVSGSNGITRFAPDGSLDTTFGTNGSLEPFPSGNIESTTVVLPDGTLLLAEAGGFRLMRVTPGGQYDADFGRAVVDLGRLEPPPPPDRAVLLRDAQTSSAQPDGSILVSRRFADGRFAQVRISGGGAGPAPVALAGGVLSVTGTDDGDYIAVDPTFGGEAVTATVSGVGRTFQAEDVTSYRVDARSGDDTVALGSAPTRPAVVFGGLGDDRIAGGHGDDTLFGNAGHDRIDGHHGHDRIDGNAGRDKLSGSAGAEETPSQDDGNDRIFGGDGDDSIAGGAGEDILYGGLGNDLLTGDAGADRLMGSDGNDRFAANDGAPDDLYGGGGADTLLSRDDDDLLTDIETT